MKRIIIGYDGSPGAEAALQDLARAGLPVAEARVLAIADVWLPPEGSEPPTPDPLPEERRHTRQKATEALKAAQDISKQGAERLRTLFPKWNVQPVAIADSPAWGILAAARKANADLIVVGSHGRTMLQRFFLGSVSQKIAAEAACSVRIYRPHPVASGPPAILVAVDGSGDSSAALQEVLSREWPAGTRFHLSTVVDPKLRSLPPELFREEWRTPAGDETHWVHRMLGQYADEMRARNLPVETHVLEGDPKQLLLEQAEKAAAESIFMGARGLQHGNRLYLGTFASAVATRAPCSVEIVRPKPRPETP